MSFIEISQYFDLSWQDWSFLFLGAMITGMSKSGIKGMTIIIVTTFALVLGGKMSTGVVLTMFITGDILAVNYYTRHTQWKYLAQLLPWMIIGVLLGVWVGKDLPETIFKQGMAVIIILSVIMMWWWDRKGDEKDVPENWMFGGAMGLMAGFTTMVGNLAGAFSNIFFLAMRLPKNQFIGTAAWLFFIINLFKLPFHIFVWETVDLKTAGLNLWLIPIILTGFTIGLQIVKRIKNQHYRKFILVITAIGALMIFFK